MIRSKVLLAIVFFSVGIFLSGCGTISGAAKGAAEGAKKDWQTANKLDDWIKENLW